MVKTIISALLTLAIPGAFAINTSGTAFSQLRNSSQQIELDIPDASYLPDISDRYWVKINASDKYQRTELDRLGFDIVEFDENSVSGIATLDTLKRTEGRGFKTVYKAPLDITNKAFPTADSRYHDYKETYDAMKALADKNPEMASVFSIGKSAEGRDIWALRINTSAKGTASSTKPGAVFMSTHHAREHLCTEIALAIADWLCANKNDAKMKPILANRDIYIVPLVNPDGAEFDVATGSYAWWRKNRRKLSGGVIGVDLNRNYDAFWGGEGGSDYPNSDTYMGPGAFSEPETQAVRDFFDARPNLKTFITYHSYSSTIMYPWSGKDEQIPAKDYAAHKALAEKMASYTKYRAMQSSDLYIATGDTGDWTYLKHKVFSFTIELEGGSFYPGAKAIDKATPGNVQAAAYLIEMTDDPYRAAK